MLYELVFKPQALKDLKVIPNGIAGIIVSKAEIMRHDLRGDVKRLKNFFPKYRLRVGTYRELFEVEVGRLVIYRVLHRRMSYD